MVLPVSTSFDVEGQRTSKLLTPTFGFERRGGSKKNLVVISECGAGRLESLASSSLLFRNHAIDLTT
jgi:hypothetical protein